MKQQRNSRKDLIKFLIQNPCTSEFELARLHFKQTRKKSHNGLLKEAMKRNEIARVRVMIPSKKKMFVFRYFAVKSNFKEFPQGDIRARMVA